MSSLLFDDRATVFRQVILDPARWSTRKRNIISRCIRSGLSTCGGKTTELIDEILVRNDIRPNARFSEARPWFAVRDINPGLLDECIAHVAAAHRLTDGLHLTSKWTSLRYIFLTSLEEDGTPHIVPSPPGLSKVDRMKFAEKYARNPSPADQEKRNALAHAIETKQQITLNW